MTKMMSRGSAGVASQSAVRPLHSPHWSLLWRMLRFDWLLVSTGISWSVKETAASSQRADREPAFPKISTDTPSISRSQSGYSLSSLFKGEDGHMTQIDRSLIM